MSGIDETVSKIMSYKGVEGVILATTDGVPIRSTVDEGSSTLYSSLLTQLCDKARSAIKELDASNEFTFMRLRSRQREILVAPDVNFLLIVIQAAVEAVAKKKGKRKGSDDDDDDEDDDGSKSTMKRSGASEASRLSTETGGDDSPGSEGAK